MNARPTTLFEKVWEQHVVRREEGRPDLIYIDLHLVHEVTSPQAFAGLNAAGRAVRRPERTLATVDHNVPTTHRSLPVADPVATRQIEALRENAAEHGITLYDMGHERQDRARDRPRTGRDPAGHDHRVRRQPHLHHGAFGAIAFGIGTSQVEHVLATQCLLMERPRSMEVRYRGRLGPGLTAKDLILHTIGRIGVAGGAGHVLEYRGEAIRALSMEGRMTVCNMSIEAGARAGMIAPDETTFSYLRGRPRAPAGDAFDRAVARWSTLRTDPGARFDRVVEVDLADLEPQVTWGTNPAWWSPSRGAFQTRPTWPTRTAAPPPSGRSPTWGSSRAPPMEDIEGPRLHRLVHQLPHRGSARGGAGRARRQSEPARARPGGARSTAVKAAAEAEGLDRVFRDAGFEWRESGCSMCLGMNDDIAGPGERCASTSNRNFEGRQGRGRALTW